MKSHKAFANHIAQTLAQARWSPQHMRADLLETLPEWFPDEWAGNLVDEIFAQCKVPYAPSSRRLVDIVLDCPAFWYIWKESHGNIPFQGQSVRSPAFNPLPVFDGLDIPKLTTLRDLADWLDVSLSQLDWYAGRASHTNPHYAQVFQHYYCKAFRKRSGHLRLIEAPKRTMKAFQRKILREILDKVAPHPAAYGFIKGRNAITSAQIHGGEAMVIKLDLAEFFPSIPARRIYGIYRSLGYPQTVAHYLAGLTTTRTPASFLDRIHEELWVEKSQRSLWGRVMAAFANVLGPRKRTDFLARKIYDTAHLPQGAPTSPSLANLAAYRLDCRLSGLARRFDVNYTRYADDLAFSGDSDFSKGHRRFMKAVREIVINEGFALRLEKTRVMPAASRQEVTGIVVNQHVNLRRHEFDRLKATLHNCIHHGPESQNRAKHPDFENHLNGRINWVEQLNPTRGRKLRKLFDRIDW